LESTVQIPASPEEVFARADDHAALASHMGKSSWMMAGSRMETDLDAAGGRKPGSHIRMKGQILGLDLFLDEVVDKREPPRRKAWHTVGEIKLLVIGHYRMGFEVSGGQGGSMLRVFIDFDLPSGFWGRILGLLFSGFYARWCLKQMAEGVFQHFQDRSS
jgi:hypothetical protein